MCVVKFQGLTFAIFSENYPQLREEVSRLVKSKMAAFQNTTIHHLMVHIEAQKAFMNMKHPEIRQNEERRPELGAGDGQKQG